MVQAHNSNDNIGWHTEAVIYKFKDPDNKIAEMSVGGSDAKALADENFDSLNGVDYIHGNLACNSGLQNLIILTFGTTGTGVKFDATSGYIGVGDGNGSVPTPNATNSDLVAPTNKLRKILDAVGTRVNQTVTVQATFSGSEANFNWREIGLFNSSSGGSMFNHIGSDKGSKSSGETWIVQESFTFS